MPTDPRPTCFLSIVVRTTGARTELLADALTSLAGQTCPDFEVVLVHHRRNEGDTAHPADAAPATLAGRVVPVVSTRPGRSSPLNDGLAVAQGRYVAFLDDDDFALPTWVETFRDMAETADGRILRTNCYRQKWRMDRSNGDRRAVPLGPRERSWASRYDLDAHLLRNETPFMNFAFPRSVFAEHGLIFDEALTTLEDWHVATIAAVRVGVVSSPATTAVYRWWVGGESSSFLHSSDERRRDGERVAAAFAEALGLSDDAFARRREAIALGLRRERRGFFGLVARLVASIRRGIGRLAWAVGPARD